MLYASSRIEEAARCFKEAAALNSDFVFFERFSTLSALGDIQTNSGDGFLKRMEAATYLKNAMSLHDVRYFKRAYQDFTLVPGDM